MLAVVVAMHATACTTPGYFVVSSVSGETVYDDNLFFAGEGKQSDFIARVSPALEVGHESDTLSWSGRYRFDAEAYARETELNSSRARQIANVGVEFLPTKRLTLSASADYTKTDTPLDLSIIPGGSIPGLLVGRAEAKRRSVHSAASYRLTALTTGSLAFTQSGEELVDVGESDTSILETWFDQRLSEVNTLSYGYIHRQYTFDEDGIDGGAGQAATRRSVQDSDIPWIGLSHQFSARTRVTARAGPRLDGGSVDPYVLLSLRHRLTGGELRLDYERDQTTLLGVLGNVELEALYAAISRQFGTRLDLQLIPGFARVSQESFSADIYSVRFGAAYKFSDALFLTASYDFNAQKVSAALGGRGEVYRNVIRVGVRYTY